MNDVLSEVCKIGQGVACCRYLVAVRDGFVCAKMDTAWRKIIDDEWKKGTQVAQGDNYEGKSSLVLNMKPETQN